MYFTFNKVLEGFEVPRMTHWALRGGVSYLKMLRDSHIAQRKTSIIFELILKEASRCYVHTS